MKPTSKFAPTLQRIRETKKLEAVKSLESRRHFESQDGNKELQEVILKAFSLLVQYLDSPSRVTKTAITNHMESIKTPDSLKVVDAVEKLHKTVKGKDDVKSIKALSDIANLLKGVLEQTKKIPKSHEDITIPEPVDHSDQFKDLEKAVKAVDNSIKAQKLVVEAPVVNVPEPVVNVPENDFSTIEKEQKKTRTQLVAAVKALVFPETDIKPLVKEQKKLNKLFNEFLDNVPLGGGGGGGGVAYVAHNGNYAPVVQESDGSVPVTLKNPTIAVTSTVVNYKTLVDKSTTSNVIYLGKAVPGTATSAASWFIKKIDKTVTDNITITYGAAGAFTNKWTERATLVAYS